MSRTDDPSNYFQSAAAQATSARKAAKAGNKHGEPIRLPSKILAMCTAAPGEGSKGAVYVAEAAGDVRVVDLDTGTNTRLFAQGSAPMTCLATCQRTGTVYAGSWDRHVYAIDPKRSRAAQKLAGAHGDFVKCVATATLAGKPVLVSGGADAKILVWDLDAQPPVVLHRLQAAAAVQALFVDCFDEDDDAELVLLSVGSDPVVRRWRVSRAAAVEEEFARPLRPHETSIYGIAMDADGEGVWTCSADGTAKHLVRARGWEADMTLQHTDYVRAVLPLGRAGMVATACRDEDVRIWDAAGGELLCAYAGHYEEVTALVATADGAGVVSASIDGTVRTWSVEREAMRKHMEEEEERERKKETGMDGDANEDHVLEDRPELTAEEEAELAELLDDDDCD